jgi:hypothetical protein
MNKMFMAEARVLAHHQNIVQQVQETYNLDLHQHLSTERPVKNSHDSVERHVGRWPLLDYVEDVQHDPSMNIAPGPLALINKHLARPTEVWIAICSSSSSFSSLSLIGPRSCKSKIVLRKNTIRCDQGMPCAAAADTAAALGVVPPLLSHQS